MIDSQAFMSSMIAGEEVEMDILINKFPTFSRFRCPSLTTSPSFMVFSCLRTIETLQEGCKLFELPRQPVSYSGIV